MAGGDVMSAELVGTLQEPAELKVLVAHDARVGRAARLVLGGQVVDDLAPELVRLIHGVIRDAELITGGAGVGDGLTRAALSTCGHARKQFLISGQGDGT
jgi:hypothetical protein